VEILKGRGMLLLRLTVSRVHTVFEEEKGSEDKDMEKEEIVEGSTSDAEENMLHAVTNLLMWLLILFPFLDFCLLPLFLPQRCMHLY